MTLDRQARATLMAVADEIIPAYRELPSAGSEEVFGAWLDGVAVQRPELVRDLSRFAQELIDGVWNASAQRAVDGLAGCEDPAAASLTDAVLEAYFADARVRVFFGYGGVEPASAVAAEGELRRLVEPQLARGPRWRRVDGAAAGNDESKGAAWR